MAGRQGQQQAAEEEGRHNLRGKAGRCGRAQGGEEWQRGPVVVHWKVDHVREGNRRMKSSVTCDSWKNMTARYHRHLRTVQSHCSVSTGHCQDPASNTGVLHFMGIHT